MYIFSQSSRLNNKQKTCLYSETDCAHGILFTYSKKKNLLKFIAGWPTTEFSVIWYSHQSWGITWDELSKWRWPLMLAGRDIWFYFRLYSIYTKSVGMSTFLHAFDIWICRKIISAIVLSESNYCLQLFYCVNSSIIRLSKIKH